MLTFGQALEVLKDGGKVTRDGWNGKDMWLILIPATQMVTTTEGSPYNEAGLTAVGINAHIDMMTAQGTMQPGWLASQSDMLSEDWIVLS